MVTHEEQNFGKNRKVFGSKPEKRVVDSKDRGSGLRE